MLQSCWWSSFAHCASPSEALGITSPLLCGFLFLPTLRKWSHNLWGSTGAPRADRETHMLNTSGAKRSLCSQSITQHQYLHLCDGHGPAANLQNMHCMSLLAGNTLVAFLGLSSSKLLWRRPEERVVHASSTGLWLAACCFCSLPFLHVFLQTNERFVKLPSLGFPHSTSSHLCFIQRLGSSWALLRP